MASTQTQDRKDLVGPCGIDCCICELHTCDVDSDGDPEGKYCESRLPSGPWDMPGAF